MKKRCKKAPDPRIKYQVQNDPADAMKKDMKKKKEEAFLY